MTDNERDALATGAMGEALYASMCTEELWRAVVSKELMPKDEAKEILDSVILRLQTNRQKVPGGLLDISDYAIARAERFLKSFGNNEANPPPDPFGDGAV